VRLSPRRGPKTTIGTSRQYSSSSIVSIDPFLANSNLAYDLSCICPPAIRKEPVAVFKVCESRPREMQHIDVPVLGLDKLGFLDYAPWKLREGIAELGDSLHLHPEARLLGHRGVEASRVSVLICRYDFE
jgi:hypothetical protein